MTAHRDDIDDITARGVLRLLRSIQAGVTVMEEGDKVKILHATRRWHLADSFYGVVLAINDDRRAALVAFEDNTTSWYEFETLEPQ